MNQINQWIKRVAALIVVGFLLTACSSSVPPLDDSNNDNEPSDGTTYTVSGTISGLQNPQVMITILWTTIDANHIDDSVTVTSDGPFTFPTAMPTGTAYSILVLVTDQLNDHPQRCNTVDGSGTISGANVTDVTITCVPGHYVSGMVSGLDGVPKRQGINNLVLRNYVGAEDTISDYLYILDNGTFRFSIPVMEDETFFVRVDQQPKNPTQSCRVRKGTGIMGSFDITDVEINCNTHAIAGTVTGLIGSGFQLSLSAVTEPDAPILLDAEILDISENGEFEFEVLVVDGGKYEVRIQTQPRDLNQECTIDNAEGIAEADVTNIEVSCPEPRRVFRFDNEYTLLTDLDTPLYSGEKTGGILDEHFNFGDGPAIALGSVVGRETDDLFVQIDNDIADGFVYSNLSGKTYWVAAESKKPENLNTATDTPYSHYTQLDTVWKFRKTSATTHFKLELSKINLLAYHDTHHSSAFGRLVAQAEIEVGAYTQEPEGAVPFYFANSVVELRGNEIEDTANSGVNVWSLESRIPSSADVGIFSNDDFTYNRDAGIGVYGDGHVATAELAESIFIEPDLSSLSVGAEFYVLSTAVALARNSYSAEGGTFAYLRDPAAFEPGDNPGGVNIVNDQGVALIDAGDVEIADFGLNPAASATTCPANVTERAVLEFSADSYRVGEGSEAFDAINITRSGSDQGLVTASVSLSSDTAIVDTDFAASDLSVRFGDGSMTPRTLALPIIVDELDEGNETLILTLESPEGCALIGTRNSATVTIVDDDAPPPPTIYYTVGGTVSGLEGSGLQLSNSFSDNLLVTSNGLFSFPREMPDNVGYNVRVATQPVNPGQNCVVSNGSGEMEGADIGNVAVACTTLLPGPSSLDPSFGTEGLVSLATLGEALDIAVQPDGKILVLTAKVQTHHLLARLEANGAFDTSFGDNGIVIPDIFGVRDEFAAIAIQTDGKILLAGTSEDGFNSPTQLDWVVARFDTNGDLDAGFGTSGKIVTDLYGSSDLAADILIQSDGSIVITGTTLIVDPNSPADGNNFAAVRYSDNGTIDTNFGSNGMVNTDIAGRSDIGSAAAMQLDDSIVMTGRVADSGGADPDIGLLRYTASGALDTGFGVDGIVRVSTTAWDEASDVVVQSDGSIVIAGFKLASTLTELDQFTAMRFDSNGSLDTSFGTDGRIDNPALSRGYGVALQSDGKIVIAGQRVVEQDPWDFGIVRLDVTGAMDTSFGTDGVLAIDLFGGNDQARAVLIQPDDSILAAGIALNGTQSTMAMVRVLP